MSLKRTVVVLLVLLAAGVGVVKSTPRPDQRNFWALNNTLKEIRELYVSPHDYKSWGTDVLGRGVLPTAVGRVISFDSTGPTGCSFDFKLVFSDGTAQQYLQGRDVCSVIAIQFNATDSFGLIKP
jgi:hypothetical protein